MGTIEDINSPGAIHTIQNTIKGSCGKRKKNCNNKIMC